MADHFTWPGVQGTYRYWLLRDRFSAVAEPGNYMFVKLAQNVWIPLYIGETDNLSDRLPNHERWAEVVRHGATHIMAHTSPGGVVLRRAEERDLIARWNPVCNVQHRTQPPVPNLGFGVGMPRR
ncbi:MAG TPA: hypothetical protein VED40_23215 [Azospirillaceae bacterium]|nr:hypothetical protein [Azospirillaceae bacterium]